MGFMLMILLPAVIWYFRFSGASTKGQPVKEFDFDIYCKDIESGLSCHDIEKKFRKMQYYC